MVHQFSLCKCKQPLSTTLLKIKRNTFLNQRRCSSLDVVLHSQAYTDVELSTHKHKHTRALTFTAQ